MRTPDHPRSMPASALRDPARRQVLRWIGGAVASATALTVSAESADWPKNPIKILVGFPAGGLNDVAIRALAQPLSERLGTSIVVINSPGAGGIVALQKLLQAPSDGYTLLYTPWATLLARPYQMSLSVTYRDVTPIANVETSYPAITVKKTHRWRTFDDFRKEAAANPGKVTYATPGVGGLPHIAMENTARRLGLKLNHIPFPGLPQAYLAALSDLVDTVISDLPNEQFRPIAMLGDERVAFWPDVPCMRELGAPSTSFFARAVVVGPKGTPQKVVDTMAGAMKVALTDKTFDKQMRDTLMLPTYLSASEMLPVWNSEATRYKELIDQLDLKQK